MARLADQDLDGVIAAREGSDKPVLFNMLCDRSELSPEFLARAREQRVIALYYYNEVTMKDIGAELGVNESRVSQLHARAIRRLRDALGADVTPMAASTALRKAFAAMEAKPRMAKASLPESDTRVPEAAQRRAELVLVKRSSQDSVSRAAR